MILLGSGDDDVCVMICKSVDNFGEFYGIVLSVVMLMWFLVFLVWVFEFLCDEWFWSEWDILLNGGMVVEMVYIVKG